MLDRRDQGAGGHGPQKWKPRCRIGVYLGNYPFHAGSVAIVFSPSTGLVSPKFHVFFNETFSTVPCMNAGTNPPNWADLVMHSSELSSDEYFELNQNLSSDLPPMVPESKRAPNPELDCITDPFTFVPDQKSAMEKQTNAPFTYSVLTGTEREDLGKSTSSFPTSSGST